VLADWIPDPATYPGEKHPPGYRLDPPHNLFLVSPQGTRYLVEHRANSGAYLDDWSGNGQLALLLSYTSLNVWVVDLSTGAAIDSWKTSPSGADQGPVAFTRPNGLAVLVASSDGVGAVLRRYSLSGALEQVYPHVFGSAGDFDGNFLSTPDGSEIVLGTHGGISLVDNDGSVVQKYAAPSASDCAPVRWWAPGVVLASCTWRADGTRLYEFHLGSGAVGVLTAPRGIDSGSGIDAWAVAGRVYVETGGLVGCSQSFGILAPNHTVTPLSVPGVQPGRSVAPIGADGTSIALLKQIACGGGISVLWYEPSAHTSTDDIGPPLMGGSIDGAILFASS
jgi:TolB protein